MTFACSFMAEAAMDARDHVVNDVHLKPQWATPDLPRLRKTLPELERQAELLDVECRSKRSIFVGALKETITEDDLVRYFSGFGNVLRAVKIVDRDTGVKKNFGFVKASISF